MVRHRVEGRERGERKARCWEAAAFDGGRVTGRVRTCELILSGLAVEVPVSFLSRFARGGADSTPALWATRGGSNDRRPRHKGVAAAVVYKEGGLATGGEVTPIAQVAIAHRASPMHEPEG